jgi:single-stranded-DNA-specific exonuclease
VSNPASNRISTGLKIESVQDEFVNLPDQGDRPPRGRLPDQRWQIAPSDPERAIALGEATGLSPLLGQVLINRGLTTPQAAQAFLDPESIQLPSPLEEFPDLAAAVDLLQAAIHQGEPIAICGDYDADGMTSTVLLLRSLRTLGATVDYAIPSRLTDGYGINRRIVEEFYQEGVRLVLTVDNGIAAYDPIVRAKELGLTVIITDHHDIPPTLPPADAILNPKLIDSASPYAGVAGVGVAYILAVCLAQQFDRTQDLTAPLLELFTLGTIADLAPLTGVNRRWVKRGLRLLPQSNIPGIQALMQVAGVTREDKSLKPEAIGFRLGPRINAIGRISNPQCVIELLTTEDAGRALELAMVCEQVNQKRQQLCELIEQAAIAWIEETAVPLRQDRVLVVVQPDWHHGVIGIVASRLVDRYGVPVFIGTYEEGDPQRIRGSARGIPEFNVFEALQFCHDLLDKYGGHRAAGGFSLATRNLTAFQQQLSRFAHQQLQPQHLKPLVTVDAQADLFEIDLDLYHQIDRLHPCGIQNPDPVFWTPNVRVLEQRTIGRGQAHLKLVVAADAENRFAAANPQNAIQGLGAIAWRWGEYCPLPARVDLAYRLRLNDWNGEQSVQLEVVGARPATVPDTSLLVDPEVSAAVDAAIQEMLPGTVEFYYNRRLYHCSVAQQQGDRELRIRNPEGCVLAVQPQQRQGLLGTSRASAHAVDILQPHYFNLMRAAIAALELADKRQRLAEKDQLLGEKAQQVTTLHQQVQALQHKIEQHKIDQLAIAPPAIPPLTPKQIRDRLQQQLGDLVWTALHSRSQTDLVAVFKGVEQPPSAEPSPDENLAILKRLITLIERELVQPCFQALRAYALTHSHLDQAPDQASDQAPDQVAGIPLRSRKKYRLPMLLTVLNAASRSPDRSWLTDFWTQAPPPLQALGTDQNLTAWLQALDTMHQRAIAASESRSEAQSESDQAGLAREDLLQLYRQLVGTAETPGILQNVYLHTEKQCHNE